MGLSADVWLWCWLILCAVLALTWMARTILLCLIDRIFPPLRPGRRVQFDSAAPLVSIIVAARDEADNIEACVGSLCGQTYPNVEIIAVNDRSSDATGALLDRLADQLDRLRVIHVDRLPDGWFGKNHAMWLGVQQARGAWLFFTDADCIQTSPDSLAIAVDHAQRHGVSFLSILPEHQAHSLWERVVQPACSAILLLWFNPMSVNNPNRRVAYSNGAFMLLDREAYEQIGGHEAVRNEINEDMHLARRAKASGVRLEVQQGRDLYTVRMYDTVADTIRGWTRIFAGCFVTVPRLLAAVVVLFFFTFLPWINLVALGFMPAPDGAGASHLVGWIATLSWVTVVAQLVTMCVFYSLSRVGFWYGLLYPLGGVAGMALLWNAIRYALGRGTITWRGTIYREGRIQHGPASPAGLPLATQPERPSL